MERAKAGYRVQGMTVARAADRFVLLFLRFPTALSPYGDETHFQPLNHHTCFKTVCDLRGGIEIQD